MLYKYLCAISTVFILVLPVAAQSTSPKFKDYTAQEVYEGKNAKAKTGKGWGQPHPEGGYLPSMFRTRLNAASESGQVNFAGHYILTTWGCGSGGCIDGAIIDAKSGDVFWLPQSACCADGDDYFYEKESRLLKVVANQGQKLSAYEEEALNKREQAGEEIPFEDYAPRSVEYSYVFDGTKFNKISSRVATEKVASIGGVSVPYSLKTLIFKHFEGVEPDRLTVTNLGDIESDGKDDFIVSTNSSLYCGTAGCATLLVVSRTDQQFLIAYDGNLHELNLESTRSTGGVRFNALGHASMCRASGPVVCELLLQLKGDELAIVKSKVRE